MRWLHGKQVAPSFFFSVSAFAPLDVPLRSAVLEAAGPAHPLAVASRVAVRVTNTGRPFARLESVVVPNQQRKNRQARRSGATPLAPFRSAPPPRTGAASSCNLGAPPGGARVPASPSAIAGGQRPPPPTRRLPSPPTHGKNGGRQSTSTGTGGRGHPSHSPPVTSQRWAEKVLPPPPLTPRRAATPAAPRGPAPPPVARPSGHLPPPPPATHGSRSVKAPPPTRWRARRPAAPAAAR